MAGPPTPPPTTATELEDAARTSVPPQVTPIVAEVQTPPTPSESAPPQAPPTSAQERKKTSYELLFPKLAELAVNGNFEELIQVAERGDLTGIQDTHSSRLFVIAPLVLSYLILDQLSSARFALTRLPNNIAAQPLSQMLFNLLASTWERKYASVYSRADDLFNLVQQPGFPDTTLAQVLAGLVTTFVEAFRKKTFELLSKAYTSISLPIAQVYLGLQAEQVLTAASRNGWAYDANTQILTPAKTAKMSLSGTIAGPSSLTSFNLVAESVARMEE
ncbi:COP9 signalosome complex subunit 8 [Grifola frondosa]|uniref:COP9 signalosome complex subunit 8 n=1 Tax=Grifola frondosa TaxID=5627 RepID=A0A1C7LX92_GRIFR|nr:COP9 signalosome complex subunit 8 [Grifola frondosa]